MAWVETGNATTTAWAGHTTNTPRPGEQAAVAGDEWDKLWQVGHDFSPWGRTDNETDIWVEG